MKKSVCLIFLGVLLFSKYALCEVLFPSVYTVYGDALPFPSFSSSNKYKIIHEASILDVYTFLKKIGLYETDMKNDVTDTVITVNLIFYTGGLIDSVCLNKTNILIGSSCDNNRDKIKAMSIIKEILEKFERGEIKADTPYAEAVISHIYSKIDVVQTQSNISEQINNISNQVARSEHKIKEDEKQKIAESIAEIKEKIQKSWKISEGGRKYSNIAIEIHVILTKEGNIKAIKIEDSKRYYSDVQFRALADSAERAIFTTQENFGVFKMLAQDFQNSYDIWKEIVFHFTPINSFDKKE